jgi:hypothetical protein
MLHSTAIYLFWTFSWSSPSINQWPLVLSIVHFEKKRVLYNMLTDCCILCSYSLQAIIVDFLPSHLVNDQLSTNF